EPRTENHKTITRTYTRRHYLRASGVSLALPFLESLQPRAFAAANNPVPRRMVCICAPLGLHTPFLFPEQQGRGYALTPYLEPLADFRDDFTVISGLSHPGIGSSHDSIASFLTAAGHAEVRAGFRKTISLDQYRAEEYGGGASAA